MDSRKIPIKTVEYLHGKKIPRQSRWLRFWLSVYRLDFLGLNFLARIFIKGFLSHCKDCSFSPGFRALYGNIHAKNVSFCNGFFVDLGNIYIGEGTGFSYNSIVISSDHDVNDVSNVMAKDVVIGKNVWIASGAIILPGIRIGDNSVIGAGSVVTKNIPSNVLAVGNPARPIKKIRKKSILQKDGY